MLKPPGLAGEKGVLLVKYTPSFEALAAVLDVDRLASRYRFVLEPSTWGYQDPAIMLFAGLGTEVLVQSQCESDFMFLREDVFDRAGLHPVRLGAGDWVDYRRFHTLSDDAKKFDIIMIASWQRLKRHWLLFDAVRKLGSKVSQLALVGYPTGGRTLKDVQKEARQAGIEHKITWFESIPHNQVSKILSMSRLSVMLSRREGASKAIYESMFSGVPAIVSASNIGVNRDHINGATGLIADDDELPQLLEQALRDREKFSPREWALENTGYNNSTRTLNRQIKAFAEGRGEPWLRNILPKINAPNLKYASLAECRRAELWYEDLALYLR